MKITTITPTPKLKELIGKTLYWDDVSVRYRFLRCGVLTDVYRRQLEFDNNQDYKSIGDLRNLRTEKGEEWEDGRQDNQNPRE